MILTTTPFPQYFDSDGSPLDEGYIYFGQPNQNPETTAVPVYWDFAGTQPAAQPIRTLNGYVVRSGTPAPLYCSGEYSLTVKNKRGRLVYYCASPASFLLQLPYTAPFTGATSRALQTKLSEWTTVTDFVGADKTGTTDSSAAFVSANTAGQIIVPVGVFRISQNITLPNKVWFLPGGRLSIDNGITVTMNGGVDAEDDQFIFGGTGNVAGIQRVTLNWFGAVGDRVADDTSSITRAVTAASLTGPLTIAAVPGYNYRFISTIAVNLSSVKFDFKASEFILDTATSTASHFNIGDGITQKSGLLFDGGVYLRSQVATGGAVFNCNFVGFTNFRNIRIYGENKVYRGMLLSRAIVTNVFDGSIEKTLSNGIYIAGTSGGAANKSIDVKVNRMRIEYTGSDAISCQDYCEGVYVENCIIYNITGSCFSANASVAANGIVSLKLANTDFDTATGSGIYLNFASSVTIANAWVSNISNNGIRLDQVDGVNIVGGQIYVVGANQAIDLGATAAFCRNVSIGGGIVMGGGQNGVLTRASCTNINIGQAIINGMSIWAVNNLLGPTQVTVVGASGRGNGSGGVSGGGTSLVVASNNFV